MQNSLKKLISAWISLILLFGLCLPEVQAGKRKTDDNWRSLDEGLSLKELPVQDVGTITILRIDPRLYHFALLSAKTEKSEPRSLSAWCQAKNLHAAINASMYLKDGKTSTGYMRQGSEINNPRISSRFGAFFVAGPDSDDLPQADILDRSAPQINEHLRHYNLVVQNYRLVGADKRILWPQKGDRHAIAAVGMDSQGSVLFLFCSAPLIPAEFATLLLELPIELRTAMYVEGGAQAGLSFRDGATTEARSFVPFFEPLLPNVLGIRKKTSDAQAKP